MRRHLLLVPFLVLGARSALAQDTMNSDDVLAAIAADAGAPAQAVAAAAVPPIPPPVRPDAPPTPAPPAVPPTASVVQPPGTPVPPPPAVPATAPAQIPQTPPQPAPPAVPPTSTHHDAASDSRVDVAGMQATSAVGNAVADVTRGICNIGHGEHWQSASNLTLEQCAAALAGGDQAYDEHGLRHAYWPGVHLSASSTAIYQSSNGSAWTRLRTTLAD